MRGLDLPTLVIAHAWVLIAFTVLVGALVRIVNEPGPRYWLYSDVVGLFALLGVYLTLVNGDRTSLSLFALATYLMLHFRIMALSSPDFAARFQKISLLCLVALLPFNVFFGAKLFALKTLVNSIAFISLSGCMIYAVMRARSIENKFGRVLILSAALAYIVVAVLRTASIWTLDKTAISYAESFNTVSLTVLMLLGIFAHIGFIIIVLDQLNRSESRAAQALVREADRRRNAEEREKESLEIAEEQKRLIEVLTHEVRQPLNNASAALQSIGAELTDNNQHGPHLAVARAQNVIDEVGMALSNALVAATILERQQKFNPVRYDPMFLADMVVMDFNERERQRIRLDAETAPLFISADPVLMRIAFRNLIDNALRYSPPNSQIVFHICENEAEIGAEFRVINSEPVPIDLSQADIFGRRVRGRSPDTDGSGMGLYITFEIAKLHRGTISTWHENGQRVFSLFIED